MGMALRPMSVQALILFSHTVTLVTIQRKEKCLKTFEGFVYSCSQAINIVNE